MEMATANYTVIRASFLAAGILVLIWQGELSAHDTQPGAAYEKRMREQLELILLQRGREGPSATERIRAYSERDRIPLEDICAMLRRYVEEGREDVPPGEDKAARDYELYKRYRLASGSMYLLADLHCPDVAPLLKDVALGEGTGELADRLREPAIDAVSHLGGDDLVEFARTVCEDHERFASIVRFNLYRRLAPYVGVFRWGTAPQRFTSDSPNRRRLRGDVFRFMVDAVSREPATDCAMLLDQILCVASNLYVHSNQRQDVLERLQKDRVVMHKEYAEKELAALAGVPADQGTRLPGSIKDPAELRALGQAVVDRPEDYTELDRLLVYEALAAPGEKQNWGLLLRAAMRDPDVDNVIALDKLIAGTGLDYATSYEREAILARVESRQLLPRQKEYIDALLLGLRGCAAAWRTHATVPPEGSDAEQAEGKEAQAGKT
jgi:hypothetical protein